MTEKQPRKTVIRSGEIEVYIEDDRLTPKQRNAQVFDLFMRISKETTKTRKEMGI